MWQEGNNILGQDITRVPAASVVCYQWLTEPWNVTWIGTKLKINHKKKEKEITELYSNFDDRA